MFLGASVYLGPISPENSPVPDHMRVCGQRMLPGSGMLAVNVLTDGPTRVLQITDLRQSVST